MLVYPCSPCYSCYRLHQCYGWVPGNGIYWFILVIHVIHAKGYTSVMVAVQGMAYIGLSLLSMLFMLWVTPVLWLSAREWHKLIYPCYSCYRLHQCYGWVPGNGICWFVLVIHAIGYTSVMVVVWAMAYSGLSLLWCYSCYGLHFSVMVGVQGMAQCAIPWTRTITLKCNLSWCVYVFPFHLVQVCYEHLYWCKYKAIFFWPCYS